MKVWLLVVMPPDRTLMHETTLINKRHGLVLKLNVCQNGVVDYYIDNPGR